MNDYRNKHWKQRSEHEKEWRQAGWALANQAHVAHYYRIGIEVVPFGPGKSQDPANCYPSLKAFVDGLVDANVIADDDGIHVAYVHFEPFQWVAGSSGLRVTLYDETPAGH